MTLLRKLAMMAMLFPVSSLAGENVTCAASGKVQGELCEVSIIRLIAAGSAMDGRNVRVSGYLAGSARGTILFVAADFARTSDLASGILLSTSEASVREKLAVHDSQYVRVIGRFKNRRITLEGNLTVSSEIVDVVDIVPARTPWGFDPATN